MTRIKMDEASVEILRKLQSKVSQESEEHLVSARNAAENLVDLPDPFYVGMLVIINEELAKRAYRNAIFRPDWGVPA